MEKRPVYSQNLEQMNLAQSIFIFLMINTKPSYSKTVNRKYSKTEIEKYRKSVLKLQVEIKKLEYSYGSYYTLRNIRLPIFNQFFVINKFVPKEATLLQYNSTLSDYHLALHSFGEKNSNIHINNNIIQLVEIIGDRGKERPATRFNKSEIKKKSKKYFQESSSSFQRNIVYAILVQFDNFLYDFEEFLFGFARYI